MKEQISDLEHTIPSGDFDKFYEAATGNNKCPVSINDIRRCLMLFYNMKVMGVDVDHVYKKYKERYYNAQESFDDHWFSNLCHMVIKDEKDIQKIVGAVEKVVKELKDAKD